MTRAAEFFAFARERHRITLARRRGEARPWTEDAILSEFRFTNVFRELDRTTVWFRENVRDRLAAMSPEQQLMGTILFRTFNRIESMDVIFNQTSLLTDQPIGWGYLADGDYHTISDINTVLRLVMPRGPWVTGAYIVKTPDRMDKLAGALWIVEEARRRVPATVAALGPSPSLQDVHRALQAYPYIGGFTGYEIVSDLRWLPMMGAQPYGPPDVMTWAHAGPGAVRGLHRLHGRDFRKSLTQTQALAEMRELLAVVSQFWPAGDTDWPAWEMREIEHTLCEWDKYERVRNGEGRPRGVYR